MAGRKKKKKERNLGDVELNLTAMLDMAFQLLAFFILTFKPAPVEGQISLHMPPPHPTTNITADQKAGSDEKNQNPVKGLNTLTITVLCDPAGNISKIQVFETTVPIGKDNPVSALESKLRSEISREGSPFDQVLIQAGSTLHYQGLLRVVEACNSTKLPSGENLTKLSFVELPSGM